MHSFQAPIPTEINYVVPSQDWRDGTFSLLSAAVRFCTDGVNEGPGKGLQCQEETDRPNPIHTQLCVNDL